MNRRSSTKSSARRRGARSDGTYAWAKGQGVDAWRVPLTEWTRQHSSYAVAISAGNFLLDYLLEHPVLPRTPEAFCRRGVVLSPSLTSHIRSKQYAQPVVNNALTAFFDWYLSDALSALDDTDCLIHSPDHRNPLVSVRHGPQPSESFRTALPSWLLRELWHQLTEDDWAWARAQESDQMSVQDPETGTWRKEWCPVRAYVLALKLRLPLRTFQARLLESGEGDSECYEDGQWRPNTGSHAPYGRRVRRGFLRRMASKMGDAVGFFVNTNKTSDRLRDGTEPGYEIPWPEEQVIRLAVDLEQWQRRFNPVAQPLAWSDIKQPQVALTTVPRAGAAFFLFRDPLSRRRNEPVTYARIQGLWTRLLRATEVRLQARGKTDITGGPVVLTHMVEGRRVPAYDLHTLRVSLLTLLANEGEVPLHILAKCVAGHASLLMTLYYIRTDPHTMRREMDLAMERIDSREEQEAFARQLCGEARRLDLALCNDPAGFNALRRETNASVLMLETGLCPVGGRGCSVGGPAVGKGQYAPVPGGVQNCLRCRFHLTGVPFLPGLVAKFNRTGVAIEQAQAAQRKAEVLFNKAQDEQFDAQQHGQSFDGARMRRIEAQLQATEAALLEHTATWCAAYGLIERCKELQGSGGGLVLAGSHRTFDTDLTGCDPVELWESVCQAAGEVLTPEEQHALLKRNQAVDRLLKRLGHAPILLDLEDSDGLSRGNQFVRLICQVLGHDQGMAMLGGGPLTLESDVEEALSKAIASCPTLKLETALLGEQRHD